MARAYSEDLRGRALDLLESGQTQEAVSKLLKIGRSTVKYWLKAWQTEGRRVAKSGYQKGHSHKITDTQVLRDIVTQHPDKTLREIGKILPTPCAPETVRRGLKRLGFSYKKKEFHYKQRDSGRCAAFLEMVSALNPENLCWVDQTGMKDNERSLWGWSLRGFLCLGIKPARADEKSNIMAGLMQGKLVAPIQYAANTTATIVEEWFENKLLKAVPAGTIFVLDNAPFHRKKLLEAMACAAGCSILWLPPYAPDLNNIENAWATIKHYARKFLQRTGASLKLSILRAIVRFQKVKP